MKNNGRVNNQIRINSGMRLYNNLLCTINNSIYMKIIHNKDSSITIDGTNTFTISCNTSAIQFEGMPKNNINVNGLSIHLVSEKRMKAIMNLLKNLD